MSVRKAGNSYEWQLSFEACLKLAHAAAQSGLDPDYSNPLWFVHRYIAVASCGLVCSSRYFAKSEIIYEQFRSKTLVVE